MTRNTTGMSGQVFLHPVVKWFLSILLGTWPRPTMLPSACAPWPDQELRSVSATKAVSAGHMEAWRGAGSAQDRSAL